jgi:hypothetical protein
MANPTATHAPNENRPSGPGIRKVSGGSGAKEKLYVPGIAEGLGATVRHFFTNIFAPKEKKYTRTVQYPDVKIAICRNAIVAPIG